MREASHIESVVCRGSWMPGANEVLGCPGQEKSQNFLRGPEENLHFPKNFSKF